MAISKALQNDEKALKGADTGSIEGFLKEYPTFPVPFVVLGIFLYLVTQFTPLKLWIEEQHMEAWGFCEAAKLAAWHIICSFAVHGFVTVYHDRMVEKGLKIQAGKEYLFRHETACVRSTMIGMTHLVYALMPVRTGPWTWLQCFIGITMLNILQDAYFFVVHYLAHTPRFYKAFHKRHHTWKQPTAFATYYITSYTHVVQEHLLTLPCMIFLPIPISSFIIYQYIGIPGAMFQHASFEITELPLPFCSSLTFAGHQGSIKVGHLFLLINPWTLILGGQTAAEHDYHHEKFVGNYALTYTYLDKIFGTYIDAKKVEEDAVTSSSALLLNV
jgi:sterol desaturase/sphingolipid hydroxylase (fatty acid hydroxylase superfamily)